MRNRVETAGHSVRSHSSPTLDGSRTVSPTLSSATSLLVSPRLLTNSERCVQSFTVGFFTFWRRQGLDLWSSTFQMSSTTGNLYRCSRTIFFVLSWRTTKTRPLPYWVPSQRPSRSKSACGFNILRVVAEAIATNIGVWVQHTQWMNECIIEWMDEWLNGRMSRDI